MGFQLRALLATHISPWEGNDGGQQRTALIYEAIAALMPVDVLQLVESDCNEVAPGGRPEIIARISWKKPAVSFYKFGVNEWVDSWCHSHIDWANYSLVVGRYLVPMTKIRWPSHMRTVVDCDDAYYRYIPKSPTWPSEMAAQAQAWLRRRLTGGPLQKFDHVFFCSTRDRGSFDCRSSSILMNVAKGPTQLMDSSLCGTPTLLFVGNLKYPPNRHGIEWFLENCWSKVAALCPGLTLRIVGSAHPIDRERWSRFAHTEVPGFVEDLAVEYARALFTVVPIHYGGGTCIKFLESAAFSRASAVTEHVYEGFCPDFQDGFSLLAAKDAEAMVRNCVTLFREVERRNAISLQAHAMVTRLYTAQRFGLTVQEAIGNVLVSTSR